MYCGALKMDERMVDTRVASEERGDSARRWMRERAGGKNGLNKKFIWPHGKFQKINNESEA
jgi:hypothetical protein